MPSMPKSSPSDRKPTRDVNLSSRLTSARLSLATEPRERCLMRLPKQRDDASCSKFADATLRTESQSTWLQTFHPPLMTLSSSSSPQNRSIRGSNPSRSSSCSSSSLPNFWSSTSPKMYTNSCVILLPQSYFTSRSNPARSPYWSSTPAINFLRYGVRRVFLSSRASRRLSWVAEQSSPQQQKIFPSQKTASYWTGRARQCLRNPKIPFRSWVALCWQSQRSRELSKCVHWLQEAAKEGKGELGEGAGVRRAQVQRVLSWFLSSQKGSSSSAGRSQRSLSNIINRQL